MKRLMHILTILFLTLIASCNKDEVITTTPAPEIIVEGSGVYTTKIGRAILLEPRVENAEGAIFGWYEKGIKVGGEPSYNFVKEVADSYYLTLRVENKTGVAEADFRIEVYDLTPPKIAFAAKNGVIEIKVGVPTEIIPQVSGSEGASYRWLLDGEACGSEPTCTLNLAREGDYTLSLKVENEDGEAEKSIIVRAVKQLSASVVFPSVEDASSGENEAPMRSISLGQGVVLAPIIEGFSAPKYRWKIGGEEHAAEQFFSFTPTAEGEYEIEVEVYDQTLAASASVIVKCCAPEGTFRRAATDTSSKKWSKIFEYTPAPGQFIGESQSGFDSSVQSAEAAATYAERRLAEGKFLSLGAWGGYVVMGFDHSIENSEGNDLTIYGNMYTTSSEAGIVWVMQDSNGNGRPDDMWYELRGSEWGKESHSTLYAVTYFRAAGEQMPIRWRDNRGDEGEVPFMTAHAEATYFPEWIDGDHYTLYGSRLKQNSSVLPSGVVSHNPYAWGYADNLGEDSEGGNADETTEDTAVGCGFDIANAVAADGSAVELQYIDFVKVQSAINGFDRSMGELSTEVLGVEER